ncbi:phosphinothricin acetyltransferase [Agarivorans sp. Toyoura001]|uniref:GNAT family N-acetyltransferase n=1 Tax=Agarivorans sp. Toyoura001 TaxID=2283141 RepID=UPI0010EAD3DD|nr:GNAT family N-acetyltransferase [Agarivorans sp. Toyoura001]GDY26643.1 phosphinothricin acetyltransferase [Agarivorans sp. Toyoura001]
MSVAFRLALEADLPRIVEIYNSIVASRQVTADTEEQTVASRLQWFKQHQHPKRPLYVIEQAGEVVAWLSFSDFYGRPAYQHSAEISLYLAEDQRGKGLGKRLLLAAEPIAQELGIEILLAFIFSHNGPSLALFEKLGYQHWGQLPNVARMDKQDYSLTILGKTLA